MLVAMAVHDTEENGRSAFTRKTLLSLSETVDWSVHRLFVIDNGSCEATQVVYNEAELPFTLVQNSRNYGTAAAINRAWRERHPGEHCVKLDNDVVFHQAEWVDWMEDVFERDPTIGICGLKRSDLEDKGHVRILPHKKGQRWLVVEEVEGGIGTCQAYNSALLDVMGYLRQPGVYGFDDSLSAIRCTVAGFKNVFLLGPEIDHIDPGGDAYCQWKIQQANRNFAAFNTLAALYLSKLEPVFYDGGFDD